MASIQKVAAGYRSQVKKLGVRDSRVFDTQSEAKAWGASREAEIINGKRGIVADKSFGDLLDNYVDKVSSTKAGERWERVRVKLIKRDPIARVRLKDLDTSDFTDWRDRRLQKVSAASVRREIGLISHALTTAIDEWKWLHSHPLKGMKRPKKPDARDRRVSDDELRKVAFCAGYDFKTAPTTMVGRTAAAFEFAIETGMRGGEICALEWDAVHAQQRFLNVRPLPGSRKTRAAKRDVPLSPRALAILKLMAKAKNGPKVFQLTDQQRDSHFRKAVEKSLIVDLHFHDSRHEAITRLSKKMDVLDLARTVGIVDLRILMVYYNATASEIAVRLA